MWLCPVCFTECKIEFCVDCQQQILIEGRYGLKHCVKIIPRMCFEAWDKEKKHSIYLYQGRDDIWYIVPSPDDIDIKSIEREIQELNDIYQSSNARLSLKGKKGFSMTEQPLDPLDPSGDSQFIIELPEKKGWWNQEQSQKIWKSASIHPAFLLLFIAVTFLIISSFISLIML